MKENSDELRDASTICCKLLNPDAQQIIYQIMNVRTKIHNWSINTVYFVVICKFSVSFLV